MSTYYSGPIPNCAAVEARYLHSVLPEYAGNPFIEALPAMATQKQLLASLREYPPYDESQRQLPQALRSQLLLRLFDFFEPLGRHIDIGMRVDMMIRAGYRKRNPLTPAWKERMQHIYEMSQSGVLDGGLLKSPAPSMAMSLIGVSGTGKTRTLARCLSRFPQVIWHAEHQIHQISWLVVECPHDGSVKQLCLSFFKNIDKVLGITYYAPRFGRMGVTVEQRLLEVAAIAEVHAIGLIVFDELQHIRPAGKKGIEKMFNFLVTLVNLSAAPIILVGTMSAQHLLQVDFRQARRGSGMGGLVWPRFERDEEWDYLVKAMWRYQWTKFPSELTPEIGDVFYKRTQGVVDLAVKLYVLSQYRAISNRKEAVTAELMNQVADEEFKLLKPMLDALASADPMRIAQFDDLRPLDFEQLLQREQLHLQDKIDVIALRRTLDDERELNRAKMIEVMKEAGMAQASAELAVNIVFGASSTSHQPPNVAPVDQSQSRRRSRSCFPNKKTVDIKELPTGDLRRLLSIGATDSTAHDVLKGAGVVRGPAEVLTALGSTC
jgi:hypothetical protein